VRWTAAVLLFEKSLRVLSGFVIVALVARHLGAEVFGQWSWAVALAAVVAPMATLGLEGVVARESLDHPEDADTIVAAAVVGRMLGGWVSIASGLCLWIGWGASIPWTIVLLALGTNAFLFSEVFEFRLQADRRLVFVAAARLSVLVIFSTVRVVGLLRGAGVHYFAIAALLEILGQAMSLAWVYMLAGGRIRPPRLLVLAQLLRNSWHFLVASVAVMMYMRFTQILVERYVGFADVGVYSMAVRICEVGAIVPIVLVQSAFPDLHGILRGNAGREQDAACSAYFQKIFWSGALVAAGLTLTGGLWIPVLLGKQYSDLEKILPIQALAIIPMGIGAARTSFLAIEKRTDAYLFSVLCGAGTSAVLAPMVLSRYGIFGMAWVNVVSFWVAAHFAAGLLPTQRRLFRLISMAPFHAFWRTRH